MQRIPREGAPGASIPVPHPVSAQTGGDGRAPARPEADGQSARAAGAPTGLVICAISARNSAGVSDLHIPDSPAELSVLQYRFVGKEEVRAAADRIGGWHWDGRLGRVPQIQVAPGLIRVTAPDLHRRECTANRIADEPVTAGAGLEDDHVGRGDIAGWSRKSRARMISTLAELDFAPMMNRIEMPGMVTLTYPGDWQALAPDGPTAKKHLTTFFKRYERSWGEAWTGIWKLEFQARGAPHFHLFQSIPDGLSAKSEDGARGPKIKHPGLTFRKWLSLTWADICGATGEERTRHEGAGTGIDMKEGARATDPKKLSQYFSKHGTYAAKEYQHTVPELWREAEQGPGRFWGYRGLEKALGAATVTPEQSIAVARLLRRWSKRTRRWDSKTRSVVPTKALRRYKRPRRSVSADGTVRQARDERGELIFDEYGMPVDAVKYRWQTGPVSRMQGPQYGAGYVIVPDGPEMADYLARYLAMLD